jgi:hypothetical protein
MAAMLRSKLGRRLTFTWALLAAETVMVVRRHWGSLPPRSRRRLRELVAKSKGLPTNLTPAERRELVEHVRKLDLRALARDIGEVASPIRVPGGRRRRRL